MNLSLILMAILFTFLISFVAIFIQTISLKISQEETLQRFDTWKLFKKITNPDRELSVVGYVYKIPLIVENPVDFERVNETVAVDVYTDVACEIDITNKSIVVTQEPQEVVDTKVVNPIYCQNSFKVKEAKIMMLLNASPLSKSEYHILFSNETNITSGKKNLNLVLYLPFDEGNGNVAHDYSGFGNDGTLKDANASNEDGSSLARWVSGKAGHALSFDGVDDYVEVSNSPSLNPSDEISVEAWVKFNSWYTGDCQQNMILSKGNESVYGHFHLAIGEVDNNCTDVSNDLRVKFEINFNGTIYQAFGSTDVYSSLGSWLHVVGVYNKTCLKVYLNGNLDGINCIGSISNPGNEENITIGRMKSDSYPYWVNGTIDEVKIWNRALTEQEIKSHSKEPLKIKILGKQKLKAILPSKLSRLKEVGYSYAKSVLTNGYDFYIEVDSS